MVAAMPYDGARESAFSNVWVGCADGDYEFVFISDPGRNV